MYAIAFDFDKNSLQQHYGQHVGPSWNNAYTTVRKALENRGFTWVQGSVYHLAEDNMATLFLAIQDLRAIPWFPPSIRDLRAYRIEQWSDFTAVVQAALPPAAPAPAPATTVVAPTQSTSVI